jgi:hypothetical protein
LWLRASIRETEFSAELVTHTLPNPGASAVGRCPTSTAARTRGVSPGPMTPTAFSPTTTMGCGRVSTYPAATASTTTSTPATAPNSRRRCRRV